MKDDVPFPYRGEHVVGLLVAERGRRVKREIFQVRAGNLHQRREVAEPERGMEPIDFVGGHLEVLDEYVLDPVRHGVLYPHAHDRPEPPEAYRFLDRTDEVFRFVFLDLDVRVPRHAEGVRFDDLHAGEEHPQVCRDKVFKPDETE